MEKVYDLVGLGEAMLEFNQTMPGQPQYLQGFGGDTSNATIAAARAGARTAYLTRLGADSFGDALIDLWQREGVATSAVERDANAPTGIYFVTHRGNGAAGHEFSYLRAGSAASHMTPTWLQDGGGKIIEQSKILHLSGISLAISPEACDTAFAAMDLARAAGAQVSFDANFRPRLWPLARARACIAQAVSLCDIFLPSLDDMVTLTGLAEADAIIDWSHAQGAKTIVLKLGPDGALASDGQTRRRIAGRAVPMVDATGVGDCFCGNFLARIAAGEDLFDAAHFANAAAALAVQGYGAVAPLPTAAQVRAILRS